MIFLSKLSKQHFVDVFVSFQISKMRNTPPEDLVDFVESLRKCFFKLESAEDKVKKNESAISALEGRLYF